MADPWFHAPGVTVGPLTMTEEQRVAAERRRRELDAQDAARAQNDQSGIAGLAQMIGASYGGSPVQGATLEERVGKVIPDPMQNPQSINAVTNGELPPLQDIPRDPRDFTFQDRMRYMISGAGEGRPDPFESPAYPGGADPRTQKGGPVPKGSVDPNKPAGPRQDIPMAPANSASGIIDPNAAAATQSNPNQMIADIAAQKAMLDSIYPQRDLTNPAQDTADAEAGKMPDRTKLMAQLAFFAGITKGAGGQWEAVGQGLAAGGDAYDQGFTRYQAALQGKATRAADNKALQYGDQVNKTDAAVKLYSGQRTIDADLAKENRTETRKAIKDRQDAIDDYFKTTKPPANDMDLNNEAFEKWRRDYDASIAQGRVVSTMDISDKPTK